MKEYKVGEEITLVVKFVFGSCHDCFFYIDGYCFLTDANSLTACKRNNSKHFIFVEKGK